MSVAKKPPPDDVGNLRGRRRRLVEIALQAARVEARDGADIEKARARALRDIEPRLADLDRRLARISGRRPTAAQSSDPGDDEANLLETLDEL